MAHRASKAQRRAARGAGTRRLAVLALAASIVGSCAAGKKSERSEEAETLKKRKGTESKSAASGASLSEARVEEGVFHSESLGVDKHYRVYLPRGYDESQLRYPVIYMLHGIGGREDNWLKMNLVEAANEIELAALVVLVDGDDSFYVNSVREADYDACLQSKRPFGYEADMATYCVKQGNYEDYLTSDLPKEIESHYRALTSEAGRGIGGLSMGGYGALVLAFRHPDLYASVASHSGVTSILYSGPFPYEEGKGELTAEVESQVAAWGPFGVHLKKLFGDELSVWQAHDPTTLADSLALGSLSIYLDCGLEDDYRLQHAASFLVDKLRAKGHEPSFSLLPGRHNAELWSQQIIESLRFHQEHLAAPSPG